MLSKKIDEGLNNQLNKEIYSAYLYLSMAAYAADAGLNGFSNWMYVQVKEEMTHAERFYKYISDQSGKVLLQAVAKPPHNFISALDLFKKTLEHEKGVTGRINSLVTLARKENDHATDAFLQWFVTEQVEEESTAHEIVQRIKLIGKDGNGLLLIDSQLATRVFVPPQAKTKTA